MSKVTHKNATDRPSAMQAHAMRFSVNPFVPTRLVRKSFSQYPEDPLMNTHRDQALHAARSAPSIASLVCAENLVDPDTETHALGLPQTVVIPVSDRPLSISIPLIVHGHITMPAMRPAAFLFVAMMKPYISPHHMRWLLHSCASVDEPPNTRPWFVIHAPKSRYPALERTAKPPAEFSPQIPNKVHRSSHVSK